MRLEFFMARSAKASLKVFLKAYERRPPVEITPTMVTAGMHALRAGLQDTAERVFHAMMRGQPPLEVTPRMKRTATELMFIRVKFDADRLAAEILLVMFHEGRLDPEWASRHAQERAVPRSIEMLGASEGQIIEREDGMVLVLAAKPPMAAGLPYVGPQYLCVSPETVANGRDALYAGWEATVEKVFHAALGDRRIDVTAAMKEAGVNAMTACEGQEHGSIVALVLGDMLSESGHRGVSTAIQGGARTGQS
jgi:hypothetical protein